MLDFIFSASFLKNSLLFAIPIAFAALGALVSNKAGILNINIEGSMSLAALAGALTSHYTGSWAIGLAAAVLTGVAMAFLLSFTALGLKTSSVLSGIALNTFASGASIFILYAVLGVKGDSSQTPSAMIPDIRIPLLSRIPVVGDALFSQNLLFYMLILSAVLLKFLLRRMRTGAYIRAVGYNETAARSVGIDPDAVKRKALILCGIFAGLGGAFLSMAYLSYFSAGMVAGRGFIGLAAEAMGAGEPLFTMLFALLFGAVDYFSVGAQAVLGVPYELLNTLPYLMTVIALTIYSVANERKTNAEKSIKG
jgi:simple sugar transport system permease protein